MRKKLFFPIMLCVLLLPPFEAVRAIPCDSTNMVVCKFLDSYLKELQQWNEPDVSLSQKMYDDKVVVFDGSVANIQKINDNCSFSLQRFDNKAYLATWQNEDGILLELAFPIQYELLLRTPRIELEKTLQQQIVDAKDSNDDQHLWSLSDIERQDDGVLTNKHPNYYYLPALNNSVYLLPDSSDSLHTAMYYFSDGNLDYSLHNLLLEPSGALKSATLLFHQSVYDLSYLDYEVSLKQWLTYCRQENMKVYIGIEEESDKGLKVLLVAVNEDLGFNHTLSLMVPKDFVTSANLRIPVKVNAFIPIHNVKNLYQQFDPNKSKKQKIW